MKGFSVKKTKALVTLLSTKTLAEAAESLKIGEVTLWRWMQAPAFKKVYVEAKQQAIARAVYQLQQITGEAVKTLKSVMTDLEAPCNSRVTAAKVVLEMAFKGFEIEDLEARLSNLENKTSFKGGDF